MGRRSGDRPAPYEMAWRQGRGRGSPTAINLTAAGRAQVARGLNENLMSDAPRMDQFHPARFHLDGGGDGGAEGAQ
eukprot:3238221-Rhodomonas_salina.1